MGISLEADILVHMDRSTDITIKRATSGDAEKVRELGIATFVESFGDQNTKSNMAWYVSKNFSLENVQSQLDNPESKYYLACLKDDLIGYLKINIGRAQTEQVLPEALEIERIYIHSKHQGNNIGKLLLTNLLKSPGKQVSAQYGLAYGIRMYVPFHFISETGLWFLDHIHSS